MGHVDCVFIDTYEWFDVIVPANATGMKSVWIKQGLGQYYVVRPLEEKPDITIDTLEQLLEVFSRNFYSI